MKKKNPPLSVLGSGGKRGACFSCNANSEKTGAGMFENENSSDRDQYGGRCETKENNNNNNSNNDKN